MSVLSLHREDKQLERPNTVANSGPAFRHVMACIDTSAHARKIIPHAIAIAKAMEATLTLVRVLEPRPTGEGPPDPVEWDIRRHQARDHLEQLVQQQRDEAGRIEAEVMEGHPAEKICLWGREHSVDLTVLATHGEGGSTEWDLGSTARKIIDCAPGLVLLIPPSTQEAGIVHYRRLLVPLDGSSRAESTLPLALRLAKAEGAELLLAHVVPVPELTEVEPLEAEDMELRGQLVRRNERVAHDYLDQIRARMVKGGISARALVLCDGDVRSRLARAIADEAVDLVVLSAQGRSGHSDVPFGSVAAYLIAHAVAPLLIMCRHSVRATRRVAAAGGRLPSHATQ
jgi:nucleotide-binding universal stress UspA family protein